MGSPRLLVLLCGFMTMVASTTASFSLPATLGAYIITAHVRGSDDSQAADNLVDSDDRRRRLAAVFSLLDHNRDGHISMAEAADGYRTPGQVRFETFNHFQI
jgi:hypothetical protein